MTDLTPPPPPTTLMEVRVTATDGTHTWTIHGLGTTADEAVAAAWLPEGYTVESFEITRSGLDPEEFEATKGRYPKDLVV